MTCYERAKSLASSAGCTISDTPWPQEWAEAGVSEGTMLALLGHVSRAMLKRYSHVRMAAKRTAVDFLTLENSLVLEGVVTKVSTGVKPTVVP